MQTNRPNAGSLIGGSILIVFGLLALAGQVFRSVDWGFLWPFIVIGAGAIFFIPDVLIGRLLHQETVQAFPVIERASVEGEIDRIRTNVTDGRCGREAR